jgi:DNA-binding XRE family transcriptional regulator
VKEVCDDNSSWELLYKERARDERYALYKELYVGKGFIERQDETKIHDGFKAAYDEGKLAQQLRIKKVTWAPIEKDSEERAYGNMKLILQYSHHLQEGLEKIWQQKG